MRPRWTRPAELHLSIGEARIYVGVLLLQRHVQFLEVVSMGSFASPKPGTRFPRQYVTLMRTRATEPAMS
jgi:hypothetical protein